MRCNIAKAVWSENSAMMFRFGLAEIVITGRAGGDRDLTREGDAFA